MYPVLSIGPLSLPTAPLLLLIGFWLGASCSERMAKRNGKDPDLIASITWYALIGGLLGARVSFIARNPSAFSGNWMSIFSLNQALLDPVGGLVISAAIIYFLSEKNRLSWRVLLDDLVPLFGVLTPAIYLANFASGSGIGLQTSLPWGIEQYGGPRHPVQLYLAFAGLITLYLTTIKPHRFQNQDGGLFLFFLTYTTGYISFFAGFQEALGDTPGGFRINQVLSWVIFTGSVYLLYQMKRSEVNHAAG